MLVSIRSTTQTTKTPKRRRGFSTPVSRPVSVKRQSGYTSIYCASKYLSADVIREIARFAGCHIFCESDDVLYVNSNYITFHAASSGEKTITLPARGGAFRRYMRTCITAKTAIPLHFPFKKGKQKCLCGKDGNSKKGRRAPSFLPYLCRD